MYFIIMIYGYNQTIKSGFLKYTSMYSAIVMHLEHDSMLKIRNRILNRIRNRMHCVLYKKYHYAQLQRCYVMTTVQTRK